MSEPITHNGFSGSGDQIAALCELVASMHAALDDVKEELREVRSELRPALVSAAYLAWRGDCSEQTVVRKAKQWGIPTRDLNGQIKTDASQPVRYALAEWEAAERLHTRSITNAVRHERRKK